MPSPHKPFYIGTCTFKKWACAVMLGNYQEPPHPYALILMGRGDARGQTIAKASVYIEHASSQLAFDEVLIKNWSENVGLAAVLEAEGIIGPPLRQVIPVMRPETQIAATVHKLLIRSRQTPLPT